jgi:hypothetical protein
MMRGKLSGCLYASAVRGKLHGFLSDGLVCSENAAQRTSSEFSKSYKRLRNSTQDQLNGSKSHALRGGGWWFTWQYVGNRVESVFFRVRASDPHHSNLIRSSPTSYRNIDFAARICRTRFVHEAS